MHALSNNYKAFGLVLRNLSQYIAQPAETRVAAMALGKQLNHLDTAFLTTRRAEFSWGSLTITKT